jgi:hypothetical protein
VSQRSIDLARPQVDAHRRPRPKAFTKNDLMPIMALVGAIYGWLLVILAFVVIAVILLLS